MQKSLIIAGCFAAAILGWAGCSGKGSGEETPVGADLSLALHSLNEHDLLGHIRILSSDQFEGRAPGTRGEELTVQYLTDQFKKLGLKPGNPDGSYVQRVPLSAFKGETEVAFLVGKKKLGLKFPDDYVAVSRRFVPEVRVRDSDVVFVGYGVVAPEYDWDDYKGVDVRGKTIVMLINDPPVADPNDPAKLDDRVFGGNAMTYYGRWTYKYEIASAKGAAAAVIVHETGPAGYPYQVVVDSWGRENFDINTPEPDSNRVSVESWIALDAARKLFSRGGQDFDALKQAAARRDFTPVRLKAKATFVVKNALRKVESHNVIARLDGSDPKLKNECVIYSAHWDHLGKDESLKGDQIYNGALDNASGTAGVLELAKAYKKLMPAPRRTILFLVVTAEEKGLLGAKYYTHSPLYPLDKTAADINLDGLNPWGRTRDIVVIGLGTSTLDDVLIEAARSHNRVVKPDPEPEKGFFYRSDHFEFAKAGVPSLYPDAGTEFIGKTVEYSRRKREEYTSKDYHKVSDEIRPDWDLSGAVEDLGLLMETGYRVAQNDKLPEWKEGSEFKGKRGQEKPRSRSEN